MIKLAGAVSQMQVLLQPPGSILNILEQDISGLYAGDVSFLRNQFVSTGKKNNGYIYYIQLFPLQRTTSIYTFSSFKINLLLFAPTMWNSSIQNKCLHQNFVSSIR